MRFRSSKSGKKAASWLGRNFFFWVYIPYQIIDFVIGKIGWLGVFTSPEDFKTALERGPQWLVLMIETVAPYFLLALAWVVTAASYATSRSTLVAVLIAILLLKAYPL